MPPQVKISLSLLVLLILAGFLPAPGQDNPIALSQNFHRWGAITLFNGLPSDNVRGIAQTPDGILWFGTDNGLARFDGRRVQTAAIDTSETKKILALEVSPDGTLWIGTQNGAIRFRNGIFQKINDTQNFAVKAFFFGENTFLASDNGAILKLTETGENIFQIEKIPEQTLLGSDGQLLKVSALAQIDDKIIAGSRSRSILVIENNLIFETFSRPRPYFVNALERDGQGKIWLGADADETGSGLFLLEDISRPQRIGNGLGNVLSIASDFSESLWVGTRDRGLFHFRGERELERFTFENTAGGLRSNTIYTLFVDREGVVWIGTDRGVCRFDASSPFNKTISENGNSNFVRTLFKTSAGQTFAGTNRGLFLLSEGNWLEAGNFSPKSIYVVGEDSLKQTVIGMPTGLFDLDGKQKLTGDVRSIADFQDKTYVAVLGRGVLELEQQTLVFNNDAPTALFAAGERLWIGTAKDGIFTFDGKEVKQENNLDALRGAAIWKITAGEGNDLWLAAESGLFLYKNERLQNVITNQDVRDVFADGADVWAAAVGGGLLHVKGNAVFGWMTANLNVEQGLPSQKIFSILPLENQLLIGTNRGVVSYAPSTTEPKIVPTRVLSQRLYDAGELTQTIALNYPQNSLLLEVAGLSSRTFPEQFQYGFLLKNSKGETLEKKLSNDSQFTPENLATGEYIIEAFAFNKDLLASEPLTIRFSVAPAPFPRTATALGVLLVIALIALIWVVIERRRIAQRNRELAAARFDLANEAERERKRIARDLHDQTLADLRSLMMMSDKLPSGTSEFRSEIESVSTEIRRICEDLSPSALENVGLFAALEFLLNHTVENGRFFADQQEERLDFSPNVQMQIYRIAQEVLTNIKRHGSANNVEMRIDISPTDKFILIIEDDGSPFYPNHNTPKGRGIANIKSRAALIDAEADWQESKTGGTVFKLQKSI
ncbi:MAG TPA: two-component regulator propeller domain-containing protein [Pyrinomonadaceae bacterium]|jgi:signal transduction histidine kinase